MPTFVIILCLFPLFTLGAQAEAKSIGTQEFCLNKWPDLKLSASELEGLTQLGLSTIKSAGEHPFDDSLKVISDSLCRAAIGGSRQAQKTLGSYVVSYWMTDEMFWPKRKEFAITALAMLRAYALHELQNGADLSDDLVKALSQTPPHFKEDFPIELPKEWIAASVKRADRWRECHQLVQRESNRVNTQDPQHRQVSPKEQVNSATPSHNESDLIIRCKGLDYKGRLIGIDTRVDIFVNDVVSITTYHGKDKADFKKNKRTWSAGGHSPRSFVKTAFEGGKRVLKIFGLKRLNDGLEESIAVSFVSGASKESGLSRILYEFPEGVSKLEAETYAIAEGKVDCRIVPTMSLAKAPVYRVLQLKKSEGVCQVKLLNLATKEEMELPTLFKSCKDEMVVGKQYRVSTTDIETPNGEAFCDQPNLCSSTNIGTGLDRFKLIDAP